MNYDTNFIPISLTQSTSSKQDSLSTIFAEKGLFGKMAEKIWEIWVIFYFPSLDNIF